MGSRGGRLVRVGIKWFKHFCLEKKAWVHLYLFELLIHQSLQTRAFIAKKWLRCRILDSVGLITLSRHSKKEQLQFQNPSIVTH